MDEAWRETGRVRSVNPRLREVRIAVGPGLAHAFDGLGWIHFGLPPGPPLRCKVTSSKCDGAVAVVALAPGVPRDTVGRLKGAVVLMAPGAIPPRPGQGWRLGELMGMVVVESATGAVLGTVGEVYEGPANDAFTVERPDGGRWILPAISAVMLSVDTEARQIAVGDVGPFVVEA